MLLGIKQLSADPWTRPDLISKYAVGTRHTGIVRNLTNFGLFLELEEGIDGLVHVSDLSWTKKIKHPSDFTKASENLDVVVLELDVDNRRLALGHKQLEENPWDTFEDTFTMGSIHRCTILSKNDKMATLELPYGIEGFCTLRNLAKEDTTIAEAGESLDFRVTEFSKEDKRIMLSHTRTWQDKSEPVKEAKAKTAKTTPSTSAQPERGATLGDLGSLAALKEQMEGKN